MYVANPCNSISNSFPMETTVAVQEKKKGQGRYRQIMRLRSSRSVLGAAITQRETAYCMSILANYAYCDTATINKIFSAIGGYTIASTSWIHVDTVEKTETNTLCRLFLSTDKTQLVVSFRGSELYTPKDLIAKFTSSPYSTVNGLSESIKAAYQGAPTVPKIVTDFLQTFNWLQDWLVSDFGNSGYWKTEWPTNAPGSKVGYGFYRAWNAIRNAALIAIKTQVTNNSGSLKKIIITGHSLGSALAVLASVDIWDTVVSPNSALSLEVYGYGVPPVGNGPFASYYQSLQSNRFTSALVRDPSDAIINSSVWFWTQFFADPMVDMKDLITLTIPGNGPVSSHLMANYIRNFADFYPETNASLDPLSKITSIIVRTFTSDKPFNPFNSPPAATLGLTIGVNSSDGKSVLLGASDQLIPFWMPGQIDTFVPSTIPDNLTVGQLKECALVLISSYNLPQDNYGETPILLEGIELIVNGYSFMVNLDMNISLGSQHNSSFEFSCPLPIYDIVGWTMAASNSSSSAPKVITIQYGDTSVARSFGVSSSYGWSEKYQADSYVYSTLYVTPIAPWAQGTGKRVVGGRFQVKPKTSSSQNFVTIKKWGLETTDSQIFRTGYCYSAMYGESFQQTLFYFMNVNEIPVNSPRIVGGRYRVNNNTSTAPWETTSSWGQTTSHSVTISEGYNYSSQYGNGYMNTDFFFDSDVAWQNVTTTVYVNVKSLTCVRPEEPSGDEVYIWSNGARVFPPSTTYLTMTSNTTVSVNQKLTITNQKPVEWQLWDSDVVYDDNLYAFPFSLLTPMSTDRAGANQIALKDCIKGSSYFFLGTRTGGYFAPYTYFLEIEILYA